MCVRDPQEIYEAGEARWGTDEVKFLTVLCVRNRNHLLRGTVWHRTRATKNEKVGSFFFFFASSDSIGILFCFVLFFSVSV